MAVSWIASAIAIAIAVFGVLSGDFAALRRHGSITSASK